MKKYTNRILLALYVLGVVMILATMVVVRYRLAGIIEVTI